MKEIIWKPELHRFRSCKEFVEEFRLGASDLILTNEYIYQPYFGAKMCIRDRDDPIPWVYGMDCHAGKCYRYNGKVYRVAEGGDMIPCTWPPDTPGMWQWEEVQA